MTYYSPTDFITISLHKSISSTTEGVKVIALNGCLVLDVASGGFIPWDNPDNIISQEIEQILERIVAVICLPILFLISVPCNLLNMLVFYKQGLTERINLCLFFLSLVDFLYMLNSFFFNVDRLHHDFTKDAQFGPVLEFIIDNKLVGLRGFNWLSGFTSMMIACERCLCVMNPLRSQTILKTRTSGVILVIASLFTLTTCLVGGFRWSIACVFDPTTNTTSKAIYSSKFYAQNKTHLDVLTLIVGTIQPFVVVSITTIVTIVTSVKLKKIVTWREQTTSSTMSSREVSLTRTLIAVSILFIICSVPTMVLGVGVMFVSGMGLSGRYYNFTNLLLSLFEFASFVNATFNFFVYCFLGSKYRETLRAALHCKAPLSTPTSGK